MVAALFFNFGAPTHIANAWSCMGAKTHQEIPALHGHVCEHAHAALECYPENVPIFGGPSPAIEQKACGMHQWVENTRP
jgi:hypothetical protein